MGVGAWYNYNQAEVRNRVLCKSRQTLPSSGEEGFLLTIWVMALPHTWVGLDMSCITCN